MTANPAGRTLGVYATDPRPGVEASLAFDVPANLFAQAALGWVALTSGTGYPSRYKRLRPRHVEGSYVNTDGVVKRVKVIVATSAADLWTGTANSWTYFDNGGNDNTAVVTGYVGEKVTVRVGA